MPTALTLNFANSAASTVSTADQLLTTDPGAEVNNVGSTYPGGSATGYAEMPSQGSGTLSLTAGTPNTTTPSPSGNGWLFDAATLEGQSIVAGNFTCSLKMRSVRALTVSVYVRLFKRSSAGVYTSIGMMSQTGLALTANAATALSLSTLTTGANVSFSTGDKFYADVILSVTTGVAQTSTVAIFRGLAANEKIVTPGYQAALNAYTLNAAQGALALSGLKAAFAPIYTNGAFALAGQSAALKIGHTLTADLGSVLYQGNNIASPRRAKAYPAGVVDLLGPPVLKASHAAFNKSFVDGFRVRVSWNQVQPNAPTFYDWSLIDQSLATAKVKGVFLTVSVDAGVDTPSWVYDNSPTCTRFGVDQDGDGTNESTMPLGFEANYLAKWDTFVAAFGARYDGEPVIRAVFITGYGQQKIERHVTQTTANETAWSSAATGAGFADKSAALQFAADHVIDKFVTEFQVTPTMLTGGNPWNDSSGNADITAMDNYMTAKADHLRGLCTSFLHAITTHTNVGLSLPYPRGDQAISSSTTPGANFYSDISQPYPADPTPVYDLLQNGIEAGDIYVEVYEADILRAGSVNDATFASQRRKLIQNSGPQTSIAALSGKNAGFLRSYVLSAAQGAVALAGKSAGLARLYNRGSYALIGEPVAFVHGYTLVVARGTFSLGGRALAFKPLYDKGGYALAGQSTSFRRSYVLSAAAGSTALNGKAAALTRKYGTGSFVVAGQNVGLFRRYTLAAAQGLIAFSGASSAFRPLYGRGQFAFVGQPALLKRGYVIGAATGSFTQSGEVVALARGTRLAASTGAFTENGQSAALDFGRRLAAANGSFAINGQSAGFPRAYALAAGNGQITLAGQPVFFNGQRALIGNVGTIALAGVAAAMRAARILGVAQGSETLSGQSANLVRGLRLSAATGSVAVSGAGAMLARGALAPAGTGTFALAGEPTGFTRTYALAAGAGVIAVAGQPLFYGSEKAVIASVGTLGLSGSPVNLAASRVLSTAGGAFDEAGQAVALREGRRLAAQIGAIALDGQGTALMAPRRLQAGGGLVALSGEPIAPVTGRVLTPDAGAYSIAGETIGFRIGWTLGADAGNYTLAGQPITRVGAFILSAGYRPFAHTGRAAGLLFGRWLAAEGGALALDGEAVIPRQGFGFALDRAAFPLLGKAIDFQWQRTDTKLVQTNLTTEIRVARQTADVLKLSGTTIEV